MWSVQANADDILSKNVRKRGSDDSENHLSLAFQNLSNVPEKLLRRFAKHIKQLDLSCNSVRDFKFLERLPHLETLIVDRNDLDSRVTFPLCPSLTTLWLNHNNVSNLGDAQFRC